MIKLCIKNFRFIYVMTISVLVYGISWIGKQFVSILTAENIQWKAGTARVDNLTDLRKEISTVNPTHIVSIIGRTHGPGYSTIDYLEQKDKIIDNVRDNLYAPVSLALECQARGIHFTYIGTGCIFDGYPEGGFTADSVPNFFGSSYSVVKGFTDRLMHQLPVLNLRIRMPITGENHPRNFITKITNYERICSTPNSMSYLPDLLPVAVMLMKDSRMGTINLVNPGLITHNEILQMYKELVHPKFSWVNFTIEEQDQILASKRSNNLLNTIDMERMGVPDIKTSIRKALEHWSINNN
jgi:dTDP-4-dehydrorhamnose reductase